MTITLDAQMLTALATVGLLLFAYLHYRAEKERPRSQ